MQTSLSQPKEAKMNYKPLLLSLMGIVLTVPAVAEGGAAMSDDEVNSSTDARNSNGMGTNSTTDNATRSNQAGARDSMNTDMDNPGMNENAHNTDGAMHSRNKKNAKIDRDNVYSPNNNVTR
jgi:hypothetical protein